MRLDPKLTSISTLLVISAFSFAAGDEAVEAVPAEANLANSVKQDGPFLDGMSVLLFAQSFISSDQPLDEKTVEFFRRDGQDNVSRLIGLRREIDKGVEAGVHKEHELKRLDSVIDAIARQLFASRSGLFWYTDLEAAMSESRSSGKPVLSLRMLGELTNEQSCANSRWFRILLYSNSRVAEAMLSNFVLHWHTVRSVPKVTVDFGGGRKMQTTLAGNSTHYVLDANGRVVDVLPGLCGPERFRQWLEQGLANVKESKSWKSDEYDSTLAKSYASRASELSQRWQDKVASLSHEPPQVPALTVTKRLGELPLLASVFDRGGDVDSWMRLAGNEQMRDATKLVEFDENALRLLKDLSPLHGHEFVNADEANRAFDEYLLRLRRMVTADGLLNTFRYQPHIYRWLASSVGSSPAELDRWIHQSIFKEPLSDPWYGLLPRGHASGLTRNGIRQQAFDANEIVPVQPQGVFDDRLQELANELFGE